MKKRPERLVFIDETGTTTKMTRLRGRARKGQRLKMKAPFGHWGTQTFIAALRHDGLTAPWVIDRPMNRQIFETYVETQLAPTLKRGDMVILDNLSSHKSEKAAAILKERGAWFLFLPPTAPISTPSKWPSPSSKRFSERPKPEPSTPCGRPSDQSANSTRQTNAGITSNMPGMLQINGSML
jgi:transposase